MTIMTMAASSTVLAYIGPGGGIALLGPLVGVVLAVLGAVAMIAFWPLRTLWKRIRSQRPSSQKTST